MERQNQESRNYRHGDLALIGIEALPGDLKKSDSHVLMTGSGGHDHSFDHGKFYPRENGLVIGYFVAGKNTRLCHLEHGEVIEGKSLLREARIASGVYELRKQHEDTNAGMVPVVD